MDKKTYEALKSIIISLKNEGNYVEGSLKELWIGKVEKWIDEVAKEYDYEECKNKDANGNACWNCEAGVGVCGSAKDE